MELKSFTRAGFENFDDEGVINEALPMMMSTVKAFCANCGDQVLLDSMFSVELESGESGLVCAACHLIVMDAGCFEGGGS